MRIKTLKTQLKTCFFDVLLDCQYSTSKATTSNKVTSTKFTAPKIDPPLILRLLLLAFLTFRYSPLIAVLKSHNHFEDWRF